MQVVKNVASRLSASSSKPVWLRLPLLAAITSPNSRLAAHVEAAATGAKQHRLISENATLRSIAS